MNPAPPKVAIVGGGPAGLMAAEVLSGKNCEVTLYEAKPSFGRKFLLAGRGGLNLTHSEGVDRFLRRYGPATEFFRDKISQFSPNDLRAWCGSLGIGTFVGSSGRVFPESLKASPLLRAWLSRLQEQGVILKPGHRWIGLKICDTGLLHPPERCIRADFLDRNGHKTEDSSDAILLALGGASWPRMGSDGAWISLLREMGAECSDFQPSNCGFDVNWSAHFADRYAGTALKNLLLKTSTHEVRGEIMIARYGVEGGGVYALGRALREQIHSTGAARLTLDLKPELTAATILKKLNGQRTKDSLSNKLRKALNLPSAAAALIRECHDAKTLASLDGIANAVKTVPLQLTAAQPLERAISSVGGLRLEGVDGNLMIRSLPGVFVAGEMLDWDAPTGGYLLQGTFATAVCAAEGLHRWASKTD